MAAEIRACGLRPGDRWNWRSPNAVSAWETVGHVARTCSGPVVFTEVWPEGADPARSNGWTFRLAETVWVDR
jgi:hypothetical protein